jgi:hypothetical protein
MADTKFSALGAVVTPAGTDEFGVNQGAVSKKETLAQIKTFANTAPVFAAGSAAAASWPVLTAGTLLTTAEDGALEMDADCIYACTDAGNRGVVAVRHFIRSHATRTFGTGTAQQAIWNSPANGTLTLETGTYLFETLVQVTGTSATSGNFKFSLIGAGTATLANILYMINGMDAANDAITAHSGVSEIIATQTATNAVTAGAATVTTIMVRGSFELTVAGTIIPSLAQTTSTAAIVAVGSYFKCERIGATTMASVGQWT